MWIRWRYLYNIKQRKRNTHSLNFHTMTAINITTTPSNITLSFGKAKVWSEVNQGRKNIWIEYPNDYGFTTQERVTPMQLAEYCK
jgi:hypothetical protein